VQDMQQELLNHVGGRIGGSKDINNPESDSRSFKYSVLQTLQTVCILSLKSTLVFNILPLKSDVGTM